MNRHLAPALLSCLLTVSTAISSNIPPSQAAPGGLAENNVPVFVVIGSDDDGDTAGINWIVNFLKDKKNPGAAIPVAGTFDSVPVHMSFYVNGNLAPDAAPSWKAALTAGHEIGNHTTTHMYVGPNEYDGRKASMPYWLNEIQSCDTTIMDSLGLSLADIKGFRTPRLQYNDSTFKALATRGFLYDCSIEEGGEDGGMDPRFYFWPYTLDGGSPSDRNQASSDTSYVSMDSVPGLWELPVYAYVIPPNMLSTKYGFKKGLIDSIRAHISWISNSVTGFDYNLISSYEYSACAMDSVSFLATLKYSLDQRVIGNRAPFTLGMHTDYYFTDDVTEYPNINPAQRRGAIEAFINYALTKPEIRFVTGAQMIEWMKAPVGLDGAVGIVGVHGNSYHSNSVGIQISRLPGNRLSLNVPSSGNYRVKVLSASGATLRSSSVSVSASGLIDISLGENLAAGAYLVNIVSEMGSIYTTKMIID